MALRITGHKWKTTDIWYSRLTKDCYINMQQCRAHLLTREGTQVKQPSPPQKKKAKFTFGTVIKTLLYVPRNTKLAHTLSTVQQVAMVSFPPQDFACTHVIWPLKALCSDHV